MSCACFPHARLTERRRQDLYKQGGLMPITSRILVVDMLQSDIHIELITGTTVLHAEKYVLSCPSSRVYTAKLM